MNRYLPDSIDADTYHRAELLQAPRLHTSNLFRCQVSPVRIPETNSFWYRISTPAGPRFMLVDADKGTQIDAFDHEAIAAALGDALGQPVDPSALPILALDFSRDGYLGLRTPGALFWWDSDAETLSSERHGGIGFHESVSPNGRWAAFCEDNNLHLRNLETGERRTLTSDGEERLGYARHPDGLAWSHEFEALGIQMPPPLVWRRDSSKFVTVRIDERELDEHWYIRSSPADQGRPTLRRKAYPMPGDERLPTIDYIIVDAVTGVVTQTDLKALDSPYAVGLAAGNTQFSQSRDEVYAVHRDRCHRNATLSAVDVTSGATRTIFVESSETHVDLHPSMMACNARFLSETFIWWSERSGWGHLYLHDLETGDVIKPLTEGEWLVHTVLEADEETIWFTGCGRDANDPYQQRLYSVAIETGEVRLLDQEETNHAVRAVGDFFVDNMANLADFGESVLRDRNGTISMRLETPETVGLEELGFRPPDRAELTGADGETSVWANVWLPADIEDDTLYPVIEDCYPGPQVNKCPVNLNSPFGFGECASIASLGFVVLQIDGRGTPFRDKAFHDHSYRNIQNGSDLADHVAALEQLAGRYPLDLDRVGIYGASGGGYMSTRALLTRGDVYKVAVSICGNHDQRIYWSNWGEKYHGPVDEADYLEQSNTTHAANLTGKLLLIHGELDDNVSSAHTLRLVDQLIAHDLDFDMVIVPNAGHMFLGKQRFMTRRRWDYFVRHLLGSTPPAGYHLKETPMDLSIFSAMFGSADGG